MASSEVAGAGAKQAQDAAAAAGAGFAGTIATSPQGAAAPQTAQKSLLGQ
jgi:hypothetical protein